MSKKNIAIPDSDETAREKHNQEGNMGTMGESEGGQTSVKSGKHSDVEKLAASRPEYNSSPGNNQVPGAFGNPHEKKAHHDESEQALRDKALRSKL